ncbi:MAG: class I SAM-dependent methyltransferase [PVC group bacterium]
MKGIFPGPLRRDLVDSIDALLPGEGRILLFGGGESGLLAGRLAGRSPGRRIACCVPGEGRRAGAVSPSPGVEWIAFPPDPPPAGEEWAAAVICGCLPRLHSGLQEELIGCCARVLGPDALLVMEAVDRLPLWQWLFRSLAGRTAGGGPGWFFFRSRREWEDLLRLHGFGLETLAAHREPLPPHLLLVAKQELGRRPAEPLHVYFDRTEDSHWWFVGRRKIVFELARRLRLPPAALILDIGCGTGATLKRLEILGGATGVDISPEAVRCSRKRGCRDVRLMEGDRLPFPDSSFDLVIALDVIEHIDDDLGALIEYRRVLKPGGRILLTVPAYRWLWSHHDDLNRHRRRYRIRPLRRLLQEAGFVARRSAYFCTLLFLPVALVRLLSRALERILGFRREGFEFTIPPDFVNRLLGLVFSAERLWLRRWRFPFGSSILAVGEKAEGDTHPAKM